MKKATVVAMVSSFIYFLSSSLVLAQKIQVEVAERNWINGSVQLQDQIENLKRFALNSSECISAHRAAPLILPDEFAIHERVISFVEKFDLESAGKTLGTISENVFSLTRSFTYTDPHGVCEAQARSRLLSWGTDIEISDCQDHPFGEIKENVMKSIFSDAYTRYSILDAEGHEIASSEKTQWVSTDMILRSLNGRIIAELHRPWMNLFSDNWDVKILDPKIVDSRVIVMIAAYKTSVDNDRRKEKNNNRN